MKKPEIMSPIKNWASLEACKKYADAVYFGIADLSLRARTNSLTLKDVPNFVSKCHEYGIKAYMTINSVIYNNDIKTAEKIIKKAKEAKVDAIIVWDLAVIEIAKKEKIPFIISTQANVSNYKTAEFYKKLGAKRVVLARELTLKQIKEKIDSIDKSIISEQNKYSIRDYFCPYYIEKWIKNTYKDSDLIINQIKNNNGKLDNTTIRYIYNDEYLNNFKETFNELLTTSPLRINNIINNEVHFKILGYTSDIYIPSKIFMERFGHHLFDKKFLIDYNDILAIIKVNTNSDSTLSEVIELFNDLMIKNNYKIITKEIKYSDSIIQIKNYLVSIKEKKYASKLIDLEDVFLQNCLKYLFNNVINESSKKICAIISKINTWSDLDELKDYKDIKLY